MSKVDEFLEGKPVTWKQWTPHDLHALVALARELERSQYVNSEGMVRVPRKAVEGILNAKSNAEIRRIAMALLEHDISRERT